MSLFLLSFRHFIGFYAAAKFTKYTISLSPSSQPVISRVSVECLNSLSILSANYRFYCIDFSESFLFLFGVLAFFGLLI